MHILCLVDGKVIENIEVELLNKFLWILNIYFLDKIIADFVQPDVAMRKVKHMQQYKVNCA